MLVIRDLAEGRSRFCELERSLEGISPRTLSLRLRALEEEGIVARQTFPEVPPRVEYALTEKGRALVPIVESMRVYGREWLGADGACVEGPERERPSPPDGLPSDPVLQSRVRAGGGLRAGANERGMHNRALHDSLAAFVEEAAWQLAEEVSGGAEVPFELIDAGPRLRAAVLLPPADRPLHRRPLARAGQAPVLSAAVQGLTTLPDLPAYLQARGRRTPSPDAALPGRRRAAGVPDRRVGGVERLRVRPRALRRRVRRARGGRLRRPHAGGRARRRRGPRARERRGRARRRPRARARRDARATCPDELRADAMGTVAMLALDAAAGDGRALEDAGRRLRRLQTALRLWDDAEPSLGPTAWARTDGGAWSAVPLATGVRRDAGDCLLAAEEEDPLRAFCSLVTRRTPRGGELAWALRRFELGCERAFAVEALTDWLLAGRALLADPGRPGYDGMAERLAVICATPEDRAALERAARRGDPARARRDRRPRAPGAGGRGADRRPRRQPARRPARRALRPPRPAAAPRRRRDARGRARELAEQVLAHEREARRRRGRRRRARGRRSSAGRRAGCADARRSAASRSASAASSCAAVVDAAGEVLAELGGTARPAAPSLRRRGAGG